jgi:hypothetical protein
MRRLSVEWSIRSLRAAAVSFPARATARNDRSRSQSNGLGMWIPAHPLRRTADTVVHDFVQH